MATLQEIRQQYPQYNDMSDDQLAQSFHKKFYADMPFEQFSAKIGLNTPPADPNAAPAALVETPPEAGGGFINGIVKPLSEFPDKMRARGAKFNNIVEGANGYGASLPEKLAQGGMNLVGTAADTLIGVPTEMALNTAYNALPEGGQNNVKKVGEFVAPAVQATQEGWKKVKTNYPRAAANLEAAGDSLNLVPFASGVVRKGAMSAAEAAADVGGNAVKSVAKGTVEGAKDLVGADLPKSADIFKRADASFKEADKVGGMLVPKKSEEFINDLRSLSAQTDWGKSTVGKDALSGIIDRYDEAGLAGKPMTLQGAKEADEGLSQIIDGFYDNKGKISKEGLKVQQAQIKLRDMIENAHENDLVGNKEGFGIWRNAQGEWSTALRIRDMERILENANDYDNPATYIKGRFRQLKQSGMRGYTDEEKKAISEAASSGIVGGTLRTLMGSRLIGTMVGTGAGAATGGIPGAILGAAAGATQAGASRGAAKVLQTKRANNAIRTVGKRLDNLNPKPFVYQGEVLPPETNIVAPGSQAFTGKKPAGKNPALEQLPPNWLNDE